MPRSPKTPTAHTPALMDLLHAREALEQQIAQARLRERPAVIANMRAAIELLDIKPADLFGNGAAVSAGMKAAAQRRKAQGKSTAEKAPPAKKTGKGRIKYQLAGKTWTGFGRAPKWMEDALASGLSREDLLVRSPARKGKTDEGSPD